MRTDMNSGPSACLVRYPTDKSSEPIALQTEGMTIGRDGTNTLQISHNCVSRFHAKIEYKDGRYVLTDLNSSNGTFINKIRIEQGFLEHNDKVFFGSRGFIFLFEPAVPDDADAAGMLDRDQTVTVTDAEAELSELIESSFHVAVNKFLAPPLSGKKLAEHSILAYQRLSHLYQLGEILRSAKDTDTILARGIGLILQALSSAACTVVLMRSDDPQFLGVSAVRFCNQGSKEKNMSLSRTVLDRVMQEQVALTGYSRLKDSAPMTADAGAIRPQRAFICVPLLIGDNAVGVVHVTARDRAAAFGPHDMEFVAAVANEMALSIENCRFQAQPTADTVGEAPVEDGRWEQPPAAESAGETAIESPQLQSPEAEPVDETATESSRLQGPPPEPAGKTAGIVDLTNVSRYFQNLIAHNRDIVDRLDQRLRNTEDAELKDDWSTLYEGLESLANLTADLLEYAAGEPLTGAPIDVNAAVASIGEIFTEKLAAEGVVLDLDLKPDIPAWGLNETLLRSALINLIANARDALAQKEGVRIITVSTGMDPEQGLSITVSDNGCGFDQQYAKDIFEPFYTTKGIGGSGMGLPLIQKYADLSGAQLQVASQLGIGSKFSLIFPKAPDESD